MDAACPKGDHPLFRFFPSPVFGVVGEASDEGEVEEEALRTGDDRTTAAAALVLLLSVLLLVSLAAGAALAGAAAPLLLAPLLVRLRPATAGSGRLMRKAGAPVASVSSKMARMKAEPSTASGCTVHMTSPRRPPW